MFSERNGYSVEKSIQVESMDSALRTCLWNFIDTEIFQTDQEYFTRDRRLQVNAKIIYDRFHKRAVRTIPISIGEFVRLEWQWFGIATWYEVYDYCEFVINDLIIDNDVKSILDNFNYVLEREKSGYRLIDGLITPVIDREQIVEIQNVIDLKGSFYAASAHIRTALILYSDRKEPDYRNSIKESISAIEAVAKIISHKSNAVLTDALKIVDLKHPIHPAFKQAIEKLYGYTSDEKGIRHALVEETAIDEADARFMLIACSAFVNYLVSRAS